MKKIKIYLFCKDKLFEWEIDGSEKKTSHFVLDKFKTLFVNDYVISVEYGDDCYKVSSTDDFEFSYKDQKINTKIILDGDILVCNFPYESSKAILFIQFENEYNHVFYKIDVKEIEEIKIGKADSNHIVYKNENLLDEHLVLKFKDKGHAEAISLSVGCYVNQIVFEKVELKFGDTIFIYGFKCIYLGNYIAINNPNENVYSELTVLKEDEVDVASKRNFINFKQNIVDRDKVYASVDEEKSVVINPPYIKPNSKFKMICFGLSQFVIALIGVMILIWGLDLKFVYGGAALIIIAVVSCIIFLIVSVSKNKREIKNYENYLNDKFKELTLIRDEKLRDLTQKFPKSTECYKMVINFEKRIWERNIFDKNFLNLTIGQGNLNFENLNVKCDRVSNVSEDHELYKNYLNIVENFSFIKKAPITIPLKEINKLAVVGDMDILNDVLKNFVVQMTSLHSYKDLKIGFLHSRRNSENLSYIKEIPHVYSEKKDFRYVASSDEELVDVVYNIKNIIAERESILSENPKQIFSTSYVIFIIYDHNQVMDSFLKYISTLNKKINVSFVMLTIDDKNVPTSFRYILDVGDDSQTFYKIKDGGVRKMSIMHEYKDVSNLINIDKFVYSLSKIKMYNNHSDIKSFEDKSIFDLYGVSEVDSLKILDRWNKNKLLSVGSIPIGIDGNKEIFSINVHEKHNGPNGIILGDSGSGKTELLKSMVLSYAINFHPNKLNFVILKSNYNTKLNSLRRLPHVIDILDKENESEKNRLISLVKSEINKRQSLFDSLKVTDINFYQNIYENYIDMPTIPNFVIIIDDVCESDLNFINEMTLLYSSMSSLGIHFIVSSDRSEMFADNDEIELNKFDFKICFRVSDMKHMFKILGDSELVALKNSGMFNAKFSDSQIFKNVEVAFSNIEYGIENGDENLDVVNNCGLVIKKVSRVKYFENLATQQSVIIEKISELSEKIDLKLMDMFNSSLRYLSLPELVGYNSNFNGLMWCESKKICSSIVGIIDDPEYHVQRFLEIDFKNIGNLFVYGAAGTGKSTLIKTLIYSLCCEYKPNYLNVYIVDVNTKNTNYFSYTPHVKDIAYSKHEINLIFRKILDEFDLRKKIFENLDISSVENYKAKTGDDLVYIVLTIDSINDIVNDTWDYTNFIKMIARDGKDYGIFVCVTSTDYSEKEMKLSEYFDNRFVFRMNDEESYKKILGKRCTINSKFKGRGLMNYQDQNGNRILEFQVALPMSCENEIDLNNKMKSLFTQMNNINNRIYESTEIREVLEEEIIEDIKTDCKEVFETENISKVLEDFEDKAKSINVSYNTFENGKIYFNRILNILNDKNFKCYLICDNYEKFSDVDLDKFAWCGFESGKSKEFLNWLCDISKSRNENKKGLLSDEKLCVFIPEIDVFLKDIDEETLSYLKIILESENKIEIYFVTSFGKSNKVDGEVMEILDLILKNGMTIILNHESDLNKDSFVLHKSEKISVTLY